jgi:hypothetical protein
VKRPFLVNYDYGQGGVWAFLRAESESEIADRFPELTVVDDLPEWMTPAEADRIRATLTIDIDDASEPVLKQILDSRR